MLREAKPDIIAITGDLIDSRKTDVAAALHFAGEAVKIAPCYYVTGNHEARTSEYDALKTGLIKLGVTVLENEKTMHPRKRKGMIPICKLPLHVVQLNLSCFVQSILSRNT